MNREKEVTSDGGNSYNGEGTQAGYIESKLSSLDLKVTLLLREVRTIKKDIQPLNAVKIVWRAIPGYIRNAIKLYVVLVALYDLNNLVTFTVEKLNLTGYF